MRIMVTLTAAAIALAGCATTSGDGAGTVVAAAGETIRYETTPCFGTCPVYTLTLRPDGSGTFEGRQHTAVAGTREFRASPAEVRRFAAALAPYRPSEGERLYTMGSDLCGGPMVSDMPSVDVRWDDARHLSLYYGCGSQAMRDAVRRAPEALPVRDFIGRPGAAR